MSFAFKALGSRDEVVGQLKAANITPGPDRFNLFGAELRDLLVAHFDAETASTSPGYEYKYVVEANGHGGGDSPIYVQLAVTAHWLPVTGPPASIASD